MDWLAQALFNFIRVALSALVFLCVTTPAHARVVDTVYIEKKLSQAFSLDAAF